ncbi:hypothetical protein ACJZ2D_012054 [Fusarium nematophilum]
MPSEATSISGPVGRDMLTRLPVEIVRSIFFHLPSIGDMARLVLTSKRLCQLLDEELYKRGKEMSCAPVFLAARTNNIDTLERCRRFGLPAECIWSPSECPGVSINRFIQFGTTPLDEAVGHVRVEAVRWLLAHGADPNREKNRCRFVSPLTRVCRIEQINSAAAVLKDPAHRVRKPMSARTRHRLQAQAGKAREIIVMLREAGGKVGRGLTRWTHLDRSVSNRPISYLRGPYS